MIFLSKRAKDDFKGKPQVHIDPSIKSHIMKAVEKLKSIDSDYFKNVEEIVGTGEGTFGKTDGSTIYINYSKVVNDVKSRLGNLSEPKNEEIYNELLMESLIRLLAHEVGHVEDYDEEKGFPGGEAPAEAESDRAIQQVKNKHKKLSQ